MEDDEIINVYSTMPAKFKPQIKNPNKRLHNIDLPFRMLVCSPSGGGKTNFVMNLLNKFCEGEGTFQQIIILTKNSDEPIYNFLKSKSKDIIIKEGLSGNLPKLDDTVDKDDMKLIILDDLVLEKNLQPVENYYIRCRKFGWSIVFITQSYYRVPKTIRLNCSYLALLKIGSKRDLNMILSEVGIGVTKQQLTNMFEYATAKPLDVLLVHLDKPVSQKYYKNFNGLMDPSMFVDDILHG
jgi:hypothetical protein